MKHRLFVVMGTLFLTLAIAGIAFAFSAISVDGIWDEIDNGGGASYNYWATGNGDNPDYTDGDAGDRVTVQNMILLDENQVRYGNATFANKSGFGFDGNNSIGTITPNIPFYLGEFTHYNNPIPAPSNPFGFVDLEVNVTGVQCADGSTPSEGSNFTFTYRFYLDETSNGGTCPYPGTDPCSDKVTVSNDPSPVLFTCSENDIPVEYTVQVLGFAESTTNANGGCANSTYPGTSSDEFITNERNDNYACLWAQITRYEPPVDLSVTKSDDNAFKFLYEPFWYDINVKSVGEAGRVAQNVVVTDKLDPWTEYLGNVPGYLYTISPSKYASKTCTWQDDNSDGLGGTVACDLGAVDQGDDITIRFWSRAVYGVALMGLTEDGVCQQNVNDSVDVCNLVSVTSTTYEQDLANNSDSEPKDIVYPTAVDVGLLEAEAQMSSILVSWETFNEMDILGFNLYRTTNPDGSGLIKINPDIIGTIYLGSSGQYDYIDHTAQFGITYYYNLEVIYFSTNTAWLDTVSTMLLHKTFLPVTVK